MNKYKQFTRLAVQNTVVAAGRRTYTGYTKILHRRGVESLMNPSRPAHVHGCLNEGNPISMRGQWKRSREARISSGLVSLSFPPAATCILSVPSYEICACFIRPMKCVNLISRCCGRINMHRAPLAPSPRSDLCAITHLLERRRIPLTVLGQRFRYCPDEREEMT